MANTDYGALPLSIAENMGSILNEKHGVTTGFKPTQWVDAIRPLVKPADHEAGGAVASFIVPNPIQSIETTIVAAQDGTGTPSPSNVRPISGFDSIKITNAGKNVCGGEAFADNIVNVVNSSKAIKGEDSDGKYVRIYASYDISHKVFSINKFKPNTQYTLVIKAKRHHASTSTNLVWRYTDGTSAGISFPEGTEKDTAVTFVVSSDSNKSVSAIEGIYATGYTDIYYEETGVFEGVVTVDDFVPFRPFVTAEVQLGQTVYGGRLNVTTGELTITHRSITVETVRNVSLHSSNKYYWTIGLPESSINGTDVISSHFVGGWGATEGNCNISVNGTVIIAFPTDQTLNTKTLANAWCAENKPQFVYPLAEPITVALDPADIKVSAGTNNIWTDCGEVAVVYRSYGA